MNIWRQSKLRYGYFYSDPKYLYHGGTAMGKNQGRLLADFLSIPISTKSPYCLQ